MKKAAYDPKTHWKVSLGLSLFLLGTAPLASQSGNLEVNGTIKVGDSRTAVPSAGTIRWNGQDFQGWNGLTWVSLTGSKGLGMVADREGNKYATVKIGNQEWMAENLRTTTFQNGDIIPEIRDSSGWASLNTPAFCWYDNDSLSYDRIYGKLYNLYAVEDNRGICPVGWHVPDESEWVLLSNNLGGDDLAGGKMKEIESLYWSDPNTCATNESGFTGRAYGSRSGLTGAFGHIGIYGDWWGLVSSGIGYGHLCNVSGEFRFIHAFSGPKFGYPLRCVKN